MVGLFIAPALLLTLGTELTSIAEADELDADVVSAVERGLAWLAEHHGEDGAWSAAIGVKMRQSYNVVANDVSHVGVTALAGIAFLAGGHLPGRGPYSDVVSRTLEFVLSEENEQGFIGANGSRMYSHAFATLFLAEIYGMAGDVAVRERLQQAVDLLVSSQNEEGAWRYQPFAYGSDLSVTVCQLMALRAARNAGIRIPVTTIDAAVDYVERSLVRDEREAFFRRPSSGYYRTGPGAFRYQVWGDQRSSFALTAAGITSLFHAGRYSPPALEKSLHFLEVAHDQVAERWVGHFFYWYGQYYAVQAMFIAGSGRGYWQRYWAKSSADLLSNQEEDGSWPNDIGPGPAFATAVACIVLQAPNRYLPILQR